MNEEFPCICGHKKLHHQCRPSYLSIALQNICWECMRSKYDLADISVREYHIFTPDNLKYLEQIYNDKVNK